MKNNKGMSLVELIIAIAMLALVITAIAGLMSSNTLTFKKQKSDVFVQNTAQETYNRLTDAIMQAKEIEIKGFTLSGLSERPALIGTSMGEVMGGTATAVSIKKGKFNPSVSGDKEEYYFQWYKDDMAATAEDMYKEVYITELKIKYSVPLEIGGVPAALQGIIKGNHDLYDTVTNKVKPGVTDTCTATYTFDENVVKLAVTYDYMSKYNTVTSDPDNLVFTDCLNFIDVGGTKVPGIRAKIDAENNAIGLDMFFAQKMKNQPKSDGSYPATGMEYESKGMINIRNSYVLYEEN